MQRTGLPPNKTATYVMRRWKTVYVSVPKAACTSLKWLVADLQEEDPAHFYETPSAETSRTMTIHHRSRWQHTPMLHELDDEELAEITPENGWFVFAVVRHPAARLWSGWQSKFLLHEPHFFKRYPEAHLAAAPRRPRATWSRTSTPSCAASRPTRRRRSSTTGTSAPSPGCCAPTGCPTAASTRPPSSAS